MIKNIDKYYILSFILLIIGLFFIFIGIIKSNELFNNVLSDVLIMDEFKKSMNILSNENDGYVMYIFNIMTGTLLNVVNTRTQMIQLSIIDEIKHSAIYIGQQAIETCSISQSNNIIGKIINIAQIYTSGTTQVSCITNAIVTIGNAEYINKLSKATLLLIQITNTIFTIRDLIRNGIACITPAIGYILYYQNYQLPKLLQLTHNHHNYNNKIIK
jgi:hypothetical protein